MGLDTASVDEDVVAFLGLHKLGTVDLKVHLHDRQSQHHHMGTLFLCSSSLTGCAMDTFCSSLGFLVSMCLEHSNHMMGMADAGSGHGFDYRDQ